MSFKSTYGNQVLEHIGNQASVYFHARTIHPLLLVLLFYMGLHSGCAHYQLGGTELPYTNIYIEPVQNDSFLPQASASLTQQLHQQLMENSSIQIVSRPEAEVVLETVLKEFDREVSADETQDTGRARSYDFILRAHISLKNTATNEYLFRNREVSANIHTFTDSGLQPAEFQNTPILLRRLAQTIEEQVTAVW